MKTIKNISLIFVQIFFVQYIGAQTLKVSQDLVNIKGKAIINFLGTSDGVDIVTSGSSNVLGSGSDLIWGAFYQLQPNNPGIFTLTSPSAYGFTPCFTVRANGNVGIFNYYPSTALEIGTSGSTRQVKVNGNIVLGSDMRMKTNIKDVDNSIEKISRLRSVSYTFKQNSDETSSAIPDKILKNLSSEEIAKIQKELAETAAKNKEYDSRLSYGFLAQELKEVFPDLVYADSAGMLSVDYIGIIPFLVKALQEQQEQIEYLLDSKKDSGSGVASKSIINTEAIDENDNLLTDETGKASLYQNAPNPFSQSTQIKYYLPSTVAKAYLCIYDLQGKQLKQIAISERGESSQTISGSEFTPGIYLYALLADGREVDVKRMILTEYK